MTDNIKSIVEYPSEWDKKHKEELDQHRDRWCTFRLAMNILAQTTVKPKILETGCMRKVSDYGAGNSTLLFGDFLASLPEGGSLLSVDIDDTNIYLAANIMKEQNYFSKVQYAFKRQHSVQFIKDLIDSDVLSPMDKYYDLVYLDSQDSDPNSEEITHQAQLHQSEECFYILHLQPRLILLDDCDLPFGGKGLLSKQRLWESGQYLLLLDSYQSLWLRK